MSVSKPFKILVDQIQRCAKIDSNVLISGEVGTGRRQVALSIHNASTRDRNNFVSINCTGMTEEQFAVDLFGLQNQSFIMVRKGGIFLAEEGTLFLHDVDELSPKMQSLLYRFIDSGYYTPVGSNDVIPANVRIICSTSSNLSAKVDNGQFRNNLFHKLSEFVIKTPNINERRDDLELLVTNILRDINPTNSIQLEDTAFKRLTNHRYTGNLIELKNILTRALTLTDTNLITDETMKIALVSGSVFSNESDISDNSLQIMHSPDEDLNNINQLSSSSSSKSGRWNTSSNHQNLRVTSDDVNHLSSAELPKYFVSKSDENDDQVSTINRSNLGQSSADPSKLSLKDQELLHVKKLLQDFSGDKSKVAEVLGCTVRTLYRKIERLNKLGL